MNTLAGELKQIVESASATLRAMPEARTVSALDGQWSARQILGHLIDSAANNHQRFVRAQFTDDLVFPGYNQEQWIKVQHYDDESWPALVELWRFYNLHLAHVIDRIPDTILAQPRHPHTLDKIAWQLIPADQPATLEYLVRDYLGHLQDHLQQLLAAARA